MKRIGLFLLAVFVLGAGLYFIVSTNQRSTTSSRRSNADDPGTSTAAVSANACYGDAASDSTLSAVVSSSAVSRLLPEDLDSIQERTTSVPLDTIPDSITALVNRDYLLPSTYVPSNLTEPNVRFSFSYPSDKRKLRKPASKALEKMFKAAEKKGLILYAVSGYRSYARQKQIYESNVAARGKSAADTVSAKPGSSEHQTGLAVDISSRSIGYQLSQSFADTKEGKWVARNAHKYGYIIRYPEGEAKITGYHYEPWHIRYVGTSTAKYLYKNKLTLEEYYNVSSHQSDQATKEDVEDTDRNKSATAKSKAKKTTD